MSDFFEATKKWAVYDDGDYDFLEKHFVHHRLLETDVRYKSRRGRVQIQEHLNWSERDNLSSAGEVKFELPFQNSNRSLYSRITSNGKFVLSYDNGLLDLVSGAKLNFFGSLQTSRAFKDTVYKFGVACLGNNYNYAFRCRYSNSHLGITKARTRVTWSSTPRAATMEIGTREPGASTSSLFILLPSPKSSRTGFCLASPIPAPTITSISGLRVEKRLTKVFRLETFSECLNSIGLAPSILN